MTTPFDSLAQYYGANRLGYSNDLYNALVGLGLSPQDHVLDLGCGTGLGSRPLIENGFRVSGIDVSEPMIARAKEFLPAGTWTCAPAEALPFEPRTFDAAVIAQAFHYFDAAKAFAELGRALKPGATVGVWWRQLMTDDPVKLLCDKAARDLNAHPPQSGLTRGFREFYAAPLRDHQLRIVPWHVTMSLDEYLQHELSRTSVHKTFGTRAGEYAERVGTLLRERFGGTNPSVPLGYLQFLYVAKT
jgi:ubiquinone/menaquinone biosynthesis C-methylase UbiE